MNEIRRLSEDELYGLWIEINRKGGKSTEKVILDYVNKYISKGVTYFIGDMNVLLYCPYVIGSFIDAYISNSVLFIEEKDFARFDDTSAWSDFCPMVHSPNIWTPQTQDNTLGGYVDSVCKSDVTFFGLADSTNCHVVKIENDDSGNILARSVPCGQNQILKVDYWGHSNPELSKFLDTLVEKIDDFSSRKKISVKDVYIILPYKEGKEKKVNIIAKRNEDGEATLVIY